MNTQERNISIESYGQAYNLLTEGMAKYPTDMWQWKPAPDKWSIHEVLIHIADSEANSYIRCRRLIAEPTSGVYGYDENQWAKILDYHTLPIATYLELFRLLRLTSYELLKTVPEQVWQSATVEHSESGTMTIEQWLKTYEEHIPIHIRQMQRIYEAWLVR